MLFGTNTADAGYPWRNPWRRITSVFVIIIFLLVDAVRFSPQGCASPSANGADSVPASISIPSELGKVAESFRGSTDKTVIFIQDAHDSLEAQENIAKLIRNLVREKGIKTVFEEGYEGPVPTDKFFGFIQDPVLKQKVSYFLLDKLRIGGAEYAHINRFESGGDGDFKLTGVEDLKQYSENIECYRKSSVNRKDTEEDLGELFLQISALVNQYFPKDLKTRLKRKELYSRRKLPLLNYLNELHGFFLKVRPNNSEHEFAKAYPAISILLIAQAGRDLKSIAALNSLDSKLVYEEISRLETDVSRTILQNDRDRAIFDYYQDINLLRRLNRIELTPAEFEAVGEALQELETKKMADFITVLTHRPLVLSKKWEQNIKDAVQFYNLALERDQSIGRHLREFIRNKNENTAVLVFGGFHAGGIKEILKQQGLSYVVVSPQITAIDETHQMYYRHLMSDGHHSFEIPFLAARANKPPSIYFLAAMTGEEMASFVPGFGQTGYSHGGTKEGPVRSVPGSSQDEYSYSGTREGPVRSVPGSSQDEYSYSGTREGPVRSVPGSSQDEYSYSGTKEGPVRSVPGSFQTWYSHGGTKEGPVRSELRAIASAIKILGDHSDSKLVERNLSGFDTARISHAAGMPQETGASRDEARIVKPVGNARREPPEDGRLFRGDYAVDELIKWIHDNWADIVERGAFAFDIDKTLRSKQKTLVEAPGLLRALTGLLTAGVRIVIISGNSISSVKEFIDPLFDNLSEKNQKKVAVNHKMIIYANGGATKYYYNPDGELDRETSYGTQYRIPKDAAERLAGLLTEYGHQGFQQIGFTPAMLAEWKNAGKSGWPRAKLAYLWETNEAIGSNKESDRARIENGTVPTTYPYIEQRMAEGEIVGLALRKTYEIDPKNPVLLRKLIRRIKNDAPDLASKCVFKPTTVGVLDITAVGVSKAVAIRDLIDAMGVDPRYIFYFGDEFIKGMNDQPVASDRRLKRRGVRTLAVNQKKPPVSSHTVWIGKSPKAVEEFLQAALNSNGAAGTHGISNVGGRSRSENRSEDYSVEALAVSLERFNSQGEIILPVRNGILVRFVLEQRPYEWSGRRLKSRKGSLDFIQYIRKGAIVYVRAYDAKTGQPLGYVGFDDDYTGGRQYDDEGQDQRIAIEETAPGQPSRMDDDDPWHPVATEDSMYAAPAIEVEPDYLQNGIGILLQLLAFYAAKQRGAVDFEIRNIVGTETLIPLLKKLAREMGVRIEPVKLEIGINYRINLTESTDRKFSEQLARLISQYQIETRERRIMTSDFDKEFYRKTLEYAASLIEKVKLSIQASGDTEYGLAMKKDFMSEIGTWLRQRSLQLDGMDLTSLGDLFGVLRPGMKNSKMRDDGVHFYARALLDLHAQELVDRLKRSVIPHSAPSNPLRRVLEEPAAANPLSLMKILWERNNELLKAAEEISLGAKLRLAELHKIYKKGTYSSSRVSSQSRSEARAQNLVEHEFLLSLNDSRTKNVSLSGGKGASLAELANIPGIRVPPAFIVSTDAYQRFLEANPHIIRLIDDLKRIRFENQLNAQAEKIQAAIQTAIIPDDVLDAIWCAYQNLIQLTGEKELLVSVRSSASAEDMPTASFAGQYSTYLYREGIEDVVDAVRNVWASTFNVNAINYRNDRKIDHFKTKMAVIIQQMIDANVAGTAFTVDLETGAPFYRIHTSYGVGEMEVSGKVTPDAWIIDPGKMEIVKRTKGNKVQKMVYDRTQRKVLIVDVPEKERSVYAISSKAALEIGQSLKTIAEHYRQSRGLLFIDTEFAIDRNGTLYFTQTRPETVFARGLAKISGVDLSDQEIINMPKIISNNGTTGSFGVVAGILRVVKPDAKAGAALESAQRKIGKGDILVVSETTNTWEQILSLAGGAITAIGGPGSHTAVVTREQGKPSLVGLTGAIELLERYDGQRVTLDATHRMLFLGDVPENKWVAVTLYGPANYGHWDDESYESSLDGVLKNGQGIVDSEGRAWIGKPNYPAGIFMQHVYREAHQWMARRLGLTMRDAIQDGVYRIVAEDMFRWRLTLREYSLESLKTIHEEWLSTADEFLSVSKEFDLTPDSFSRWFEVYKRLNGYMGVAFPLEKVLNGWFEETMRRKNVPEPYYSQVRSEMSPMFGETQAKLMLRDYKTLLDGLTGKSELLADIRKAAGIKDFTPLKTQHPDFYQKLLAYSKQYKIIRDIDIAMHLENSVCYVLDQLIKDADSQREIKIPESQVADFYPDDVQFQLAARLVFESARVRQDSHHIKVRGQWYFLDKINELLVFLRKKGEAETLEEVFQHSPEWLQEQISRYQSDRSESRFRAEAPATIENHPEIVRSEARTQQMPQVSSRLAKTVLRFGKTMRRGQVGKPTLWIFEIHDVEFDSETEKLFLERIQDPKYGLYLFSEDDLRQWAAVDWESVRVPIRISPPRPDGATEVLAGITSSPPTYLPEVQSNVEEAASLLEQTTEEDIRISCTGLARIIFNIQGKKYYLFPLNHNASVLGEYKLGSVGGGIGEITPAGLAFLEDKLQVQFDKKPKLGPEAQPSHEEIDLRFTMAKSRVPEYLKWFLDRRDRETDVFREMGEELVDEQKVLSPAEWEQLVRERSEVRLEKMPAPKSNPAPVPVPLPVRDHASQGSQTETVPAGDRRSEARLMAVQNELLNDRSDRMVRRVRQNRQPVTVYVDAEDFPGLSPDQKQEYLVLALSNTSLHVVVYNENGQVPDTVLIALLKLRNVTRTGMNLARAEARYTRVGVPGVHLSKKILPSPELVRNLRKRVAFFKTQGKNGGTLAAALLWTWSGGEDARMHEINQGSDGLWIVAESLVSALQQSYDTTLAFAAAA